MKSRDLEILGLASVIYVTLGKSLHFDHPVYYNDKVRPYKQFSKNNSFSPPVWGRAGQLLKYTTPKLGDLTQ